MYGPGASVRRQVQASAGKRESQLQSRCGIASRPNHRSGSCAQPASALGGVRIGTCSSGSDASARRTRRALVTGTNLAVNSAAQRCCRGAAGAASASSSCICSEFVPASRRR